NVLVKDNLECCLADFGLSVVAESYKQETTSRNVLAGSTQWMAPELFDTRFPLPNPDPRKRDIYAFACTIVEVYTQKRPFPNHHNDAAVCVDVIHGRRPDRPFQTDFHDGLWALVERCWDQNPCNRPGSAVILNDMMEFASLPTSSAEYSPGTLKNDGKSDKVGTSLSPW
ncbi:kinase-like domain-containing protein, partial [Flagelloscypha sp. PMI_526]